MKLSEYSRNQEYRVERIFTKHGMKAKRVPLSGACPEIGKGDVKVEDGRILIDHKSTRGAKTITLHKGYLEKIQREAGDENLGIITFSFFRDGTVYAALPLERLIPYLKCEPPIPDEDVVS
jgi:hypothetical protein